MQPSNALEKTYKVSQAEIREAAGLAAAAKGFDLNLDGANGGVVGRWTRDGKHLGLATKRGHISTLNFQSSTLGSEIFLNESCRDFTCVLAFPSCLGTPFAHHCFLSSPQRQLPSLELILRGRSEEARFHLRPGRYRVAVRIHFH